MPDERIDWVVAFGLEFHNAGAKVSFVRELFGSEAIYFPFLRLHNTTISLFGIGRKWFERAGWFLDASPEIFKLFNSLLAHSVRVGQSVKVALYHTL